MTVYGITAFVSAFAVVYVTKLKYSRMICFLLAALMSYPIFIVMLFWKPTVSQTYVLFILPCLSNVADSITEPFITGIGKRNLYYSRNSHLVRILSAQ
jgi:hypothetical protein